MRRLKEADDRLLHFSRTSINVVDFQVPAECAVLVIGLSQPSAEGHSEEHQVSLAARRNIRIKHFEVERVLSIESSAGQGRKV
jgi:hypothetical protein